MSGWATSTTRRPPRRRHVDEAALDGLGQRRRRIDAARDARQAVDRQRAGDGDRGDQGLGVGRARGEPAEDHRGVRVGRRQRSPSGRQRRRFELVHQHERLQRVAAGVVVQPGDGSRAQAHAGTGADQIGERPGAERADPQPQATAIAHEPVERLEAWARRALDDDEGGPAIVQAAGGERQRLHGDEVGPLGVVDDDEQRTVPAVLLHEPEDHLADGQRIRAGPGTAHRRWRRQPRRGGLAQQLIDDAEVELPLELVAAGPQHDGGRRHRRGDRSRQGRLADPGVALDQHDLWRPGQRPLEDRGGRGLLGGAAHQDLRVPRPLAARTPVARAPSPAGTCRSHPHLIRGAPAAPPWPESTRS